MISGMLERTRVTAPSLFAVLAALGGVLASRTAESVGLGVDMKKSGLLKERRLFYVSGVLARRQSLISSTRGRAAAESTSAGR